MKPFKKDATSKILSLGKSFSDGFVLLLVFSLFPFVTTPQELRLNQPPKKKERLVTLKIAHMFCLVGLTAF